MSRFVTHVPLARFLLLMHGNEEIGHISWTINAILKRQLSELNQRLRATIERPSLCIVVLAPMLVVEDFSPSF